ncbi:unnamed protein product [Paramecium primaurelia]|uniref:Uncharacterized protein n=1 Tax=Paramecium primaurelia TaxID=5886 RepID=A0A8S1JQM8_PARPR|nr:unnamed protein product [Paramecium primaurelia]
MIIIPYWNPIKQRQFYLVAHDFIFMQKHKLKLIKYIKQTSMGKNCLLKFYQIQEIQQ